MSPDVSIDSVRLIIDVACIDRAIGRLHDRCRLISNVDRQSSIAMSPDVSTDSVRLIIDVACIDRDIRRLYDPCRLISNGDTSGFDFDVRGVKEICVRIGRA
jgi:hypothetical protein